MYYISTIRNISNTYTHAYMHISIYYVYTLILTYYHIILYQVVAQLLPQTSHPADARSLVQKMLKGNKTELLQLRRLIGNYYRPLLGTFDGYYALDLANEMDRACMTRLLELSKTTGEARKRKSPICPGMIGDFSQKGNW